MTAAASSSTASRSAFFGGVATKNALRERMPVCQAKVSMVSSYGRQFFICIVRDLTEAALCLWIWLKERVCVVGFGVVGRIWNVGMIGRGRRVAPFHFGASM